MTKRYFGLDIMRTMAISLVLLCHYSSPLYPFVSGATERIYNIANWLAGYFGVEIFFVLSGFLIGSIYLKTQKTTLDQPASSVIKFLKRRWLRTLPNYFLFVLVNVLVVYLLGKSLDILAFIKVITFFQKINPFVSVGFFAVSWSLAVEEWFYFLMPISYLILFAVTKRKDFSIKYSVALLFIVPMVAKIWYCTVYPVHANHEEVFRYVTFFRLDAIFFGVAFAWAWGTDAIKAKIQKNTSYLLFLGLGLLLISFVYAYLFLAKSTQISYLYALFSPFCCISISMCMPYLLTLKNESGSLFSKCIFLMSTTSYSIYLSHVPIKELFDHYIKSRLNSNSLSINLCYIILLLSATITVSYFIYQKFELKILQYRDRVVHE